MKKLMLFAVSLLCVAAARAQQPSTGSADGGVPIEEYLPKVIIEGKWGTGPGEFGKQAGYEDDDVPSSLAVDSGGNIYVLDYVNNRIQKFSKEGKYLRSLPVDGYLGKIVGWNVMRNGQWWEEPSRPAGIEDRDARPIVKADKAIGINIVIDSKDSLYYYLKRIKDGKESGEVWQFRNDKLIGKHSGKRSSMVQKDSGTEDVHLYEKNRGGVVFKNRSNGRTSVKARKGEAFFDDATAKARRISGRVHREKDGLVGVTCEESGELWTNYYADDGSLVKRYRWGSRPEVLGYSNDNKTMYLTDISSEGFKIAKYERQIRK